MRKDSHPTQLAAMCHTAGAQVLPQVEITNSPRLRGSTGPPLNATGNSFAAAHIAGLLARILRRYPGGIEPPRVRLVEKNGARLVVCFPARQYCDAYPRLARVANEREGRCRSI